MKTKSIQKFIDKEKEAILREANLQCEKNRLEVDKMFAMMQFQHGRDGAELEHRANRRWWQL